MKQRPLSSIEDFASRLQERLVQLNQELARHEGARGATAVVLAEAEQRVAASCNEAELLAVVLDRLQNMEQVWQRKFQKSLETIVSEGLSLVFGGELELQIQPSTKSDMSAVEFVLIKDGKEESILEGQGGGYVDVIAFLLRVLLIVASRPLLRSLLVMDEPFAQISPEYRQPLGEMVAALIDRLGFQMVMVTHEREFVGVADVAYSFRVVLTATQVEVLKGLDEDRSNAAHTGGGG